MEEKSRLEQFKEFVEMDPSDTFSRYALAMEYLGASQFDEAVHHFQEVLRLDPTYSAAYFQASIASRKSQKLVEAKQFLTKGIEVAEKKGDWHTRDEMKAALQQLEDEM
jgi:tetratricopeptide (TPR) repeat protein